MAGIMYRGFRRRPIASYLTRLIHDLAVVMIFLDSSVRIRGAQS